MRVTDAELTTLAASHDIIRLGALADAARRQRDGTANTLVPVATVPAESGAPAAHPPSAGEVRIVGVPASRGAAVDRVREVAAASSGAVVTGFTLADLEALSASEGLTLRALLEEMR